MEKASAQRELLELFKSKLKQRLVGFWSNSEELHGKVAIALMKLFTANPRSGWIRASDVPGPEVFTELSRLSGENARLRRELEAARMQTAEDASTTRHKLAVTLRNNKIQVSLWRKDATEWEKGLELTLWALFRLIAPELFVERSTAELSKFIGAMLKGKVAVRSTWPIPSNSVKGWLGDLVALGLVEPSTLSTPSTIRMTTGHLRVRVGNFTRRFGASCSSKSLRKRSTRQKRSRRARMLQQRRATALVLRSSRPTHHQVIYGALSEVFEDALPQNVPVDERFTDSVVAEELKREILVADGVAFERLRKAIVKDGEWWPAAPTPAV